MAQNRWSAIEIASKRKALAIQQAAVHFSEIFGINTYGDKAMRSTLPDEVYQRVRRAMLKGKSIDTEIADIVAAAAKNWAINKGATHYTHWFQPLTGATAEKHDSFFDVTAGMEDFQGTALVQQEPNASSFPSGGMRSTFEARGYTAWDVSSPMFIFRDTLFIPTIFVSYNGEALDYKTPLLKAVKALNKAAVSVCRHFDRNVNSVRPMLGCEQEYFVVDAALYQARPDLVMTGRTVFGHNPARGQQLDDHYFGAIPNRIYSFIREFEAEALKLGIPVKTRHNEVAPGQFEVAPQHLDINISVDHNLLLRDLMSRIAEYHNLKVIFHEKPFSGLNGNGKHINWSLLTNTGVNLFQPTASARDNLLFLIFLVCTIKAVYRHAGLLRASVASAANDERLGANEAPPPIMSVFVGAQLRKVLDELERNGNIEIQKGDNMYMKLGIDQVPHIILDNTDRNRTSPFAFTGSKFEFRAVGADANPAAPMTVLNMILARQLTEFDATVEDEVELGNDRRVAMVNCLRAFITESKDILFEGDGSSGDWIEKARKKGLAYIQDTPDALDAYISEQTQEVYEKTGVLTSRELQARYRLMLNNYILKIQIESKVITDLSLNHVIPTAISYQNRLLENAQGLEHLNLDAGMIRKTIEDIGNSINTIQRQVEKMNQERMKADQESDSRRKATIYCKKIKHVYFESIRQSVDSLELLVDDDDWPLVKYRELLFLR